MESIEQTQPLTEAGQHRVHWARILRGIASGAQVLMMAALFVTWKELDWPFWTAFERCLIAGVAIYSALAVAIAVLLTLARVQPIALLVGPAIRLLSIGIYAVLRFVHGVSPTKSGAILLLLYIASWFLIRRIEKRVRRRFKW